MKGKRQRHGSELALQWAWRLFTGWSRLELDARQLMPRERWSVVAATVPAVLRNRYVRPAMRWFLARVPAWVVAGRLQQCGHHWYRIPNRKAAEHVRLRFDVYPIDIGDYVRIEHGRATAVGYAGTDWSEIIYILPGGAFEPDPKSPAMAKAWAAYWKSVRR